VPLVHCASTTSPQPKPFPEMSAQTLQQQDKPDARYQPRGPTIGEPRAEQCAGQYSLEMRDKQIPLKPFVFSRCATWLHGIARQVDLRMKRLANGSIPSAGQASPAPLVSQAKMPRICPTWCR